MRYKVIVVLAKQNALNEALGSYAKLGWNLHTCLLTNDCYTLIFERDD